MLATPPSTTAQSKNHSYLVNQKTNTAEIYIHNKLIDDYQSNSLDYGSALIKSIMRNESSHYVILYKELLFIDSVTEFIRKYYTLSESNEPLHKLINYYDKYSKIFPNYNAINEGKYFFRNIQRKQIMIDLQEEMEYEEKEKKKKLDDGIDIGLNYDLFNTDIYESITNDNNREEIAMIFSIDIREEKGEDDSEMIEGIEVIITKIDNSQSRLNQYKHESQNTSISQIMNNNTKSVLKIPSNIKELKLKSSSKINSFARDKFIKKNISSSLIENCLKGKLTKSNKAKRIFNNSISHINPRNNSQFNSNNNSSILLSSKKELFPNNNDPSTIQFINYNLISSINLDNFASVQSRKGKNNNPKYQASFYSPEENTSNTRIVFSRNTNVNSLLNQKVNRSVIQRTNNNSSINKNYIDRTQRQLKASYNIGSINSIKEFKESKCKRTPIVNGIVSKLKDSKMNKQNRNPQQVFQSFLKETLKIINDSSKKKLKTLVKTRSNENFKEKIITDKDKEVYCQLNKNKNFNKVILIFTRDKKIVTNGRKSSALYSHCRNNIAQKVYEYQTSKIFNTRNSKASSYN